MNLHTQARTSEFPSLGGDLEDISLEGSFQMRNNYSLQVRLYYEQYKSADWALDDVKPDSIGNLITLGLVDPSYSNFLVRLGIEKSFKR